MSFISKVATKLRLVLYDRVFTNSVFGYNKKSKATMDDEFKKGKWNYLEGDKEKVRYTNMVSLYIKLKPEGTSLDIGCAQGVLYYYFKEADSSAAMKYSGIDISEEAIQIAKNKFPEGNFRVLNFETKRVSDRFDVIIFNETLYYFNWPMKILQKCVSDNLKDDGVFIVSMFDYHGRNDRIWDQIRKKFKIVDEANAVNSSNQKWIVKAFVPV